MNHHNVVIEDLLEAEADIDVKNSNGHTALMLACIHGNPDTVSLLLKYAPDVELKDNSGVYAMLLCCCVIIKQEAETRGGLGTPYFVTD